MTTQTIDASDRTFSSRKEAETKLKAARAAFQHYPKPGHIEVDSVMNGPVNSDIAYWTGVLAGLDHAALLQKVAASNEAPAPLELRGLSHASLGRVLAGDTPGKLVVREDGVVVFQPQTDFPSNMPGDPDESY